MAELALVLFVVAAAAAVFVGGLVWLSRPDVAEVKSPLAVYRDNEGQPLEAQVSAVAESLHRHCYLCHPEAVEAWLYSFGWVDADQLELAAACLSLGLAAGRVHNRRSPGDKAAVDGILSGG